MQYLWDHQLSDREVHFIGTIFVQWGALEHEIFIQTLMTFGPREGESEVPALPKEMNNLQFSGVLSLWSERVAKTCRGRRGKALQAVYSEIVTLKDVRDALTHGMWHWTAENLGEIRTVRVKKRETITSHFSAESLGDIASRLGEINFKLRFPGGVGDLVRHRIKDGSYMSRRALAAFSGATVDVDGFPTAHPGRGESRADGSDD